MVNCELCGEPMPPGEEMFKFHGYSGPCPKPPLPKAEAQAAPEPTEEFAKFRRTMKAIKEEAREMSVFTGAPANDCVAAAVAVFVAGMQAD